MENKKEIDLKKWSKFIFVLEVILYSAASFSALVVSDHYFNGSFGMLILFCVIFAIIGKYLEMFIKSIVEHSIFLRKPLEKN